MRNSVTHSLIAHHFVANWSFVARSSLFWFKNSLFRCEVVKNAFSWKIQDWLISMQAIYQRFLLDEFFVHIHIISELLKRKCQNDKTKKLSPTKRVFYPKQRSLKVISISWLVFVHIKRSSCTRGTFVHFERPVSLARSVRLARSVVPYLTPRNHGAYGALARAAQPA